MSMSCQMLPPPPQDMVTALSGSGPAYFMLVMEAITDAGVHMGLPRRMARQLVIETMYGASQLARESGDHPAYLRENITSPGGTTAAALFACEEGGLRTVLQKAVWAAYRYVLIIRGGEDVSYVHSRKAVLTSSHSDAQIQPLPGGWRPRLQRRPRPRAAFSAAY